MFTEAKDDQELKDVEKKLKKLLTVAKSKFYLLRVNYPAAFEKVQEENEEQTEEGREHDPFAKSTKDLYREREKTLQPDPSLQS